VPRSCGEEFFVERRWSSLEWFKGAPACVARVSRLGSEGGRKQRKLLQQPPVMAHKVMDPDSLNANVKKTVYAVRGELYLRASELQKEGKKVKSFEPFRLLFLTEAQYPLPHLGTRNATAHILLKISFLVL